MSKLNRIYLRKADARDDAFLFALRNDKASRVNSISTQEITEVSHRRWLLDVLHDPLRYLFMVMNSDGVPVGMVRFDHDLSSGSARISVAVDQCHRGKGIAYLALTEGINIVRQASPQIKKLHAEVKLKNVASRRLFNALGFHEVSPIVTNPQIVHFSLNL